MPPLSQKPLSLNARDLFISWASSSFYRLHHLIIFLQLKKEKKVYCTCVGLKRNLLFSTDILQQLKDGRSDQDEKDKTKKIGADGITGFLFLWR